MGDGVERGNLEERVSELGLQGKIVFTGSRNGYTGNPVDSGHIPTPFIKRGFTYGALGSQAASLPVVATNVGAIPTVIEDGVTGILIPPKGSDAIAKAIVRILSDRKLAS